MGSRTAHSGSAAVLDRLLPSGQGVCRPDTLVSPDVLPYRPNRGLHLTLTRYAEPHATEAHADFAWTDRTLVPALLDVDGVAGAWTFTFHRHQDGRIRLNEPAANDLPDSLRIRLLYLDGDPERSVQEARTVEESLGGPDTPGREVLVSTPLRTIVPWQDW